MNNKIQNVTSGRVVVDLDDNLRIVEFNQDFCDISGIDSSDAAGGNVNMLSFIYEGQRDDYCKKLAEAGSSGGTIEHTLLCADGSEKNVLCAVKRYNSKNGHECAVLILNDLTAHFDFNNDHVRSMHEIEELINSVLGGVAVFSVTDGDIALLKSTPEFKDVLESCADSEHSCDGIIGNAKRCGTTGEGFEEILRVVKPDGRRLYIKFKGKYYGEYFDGSELVYITASDITAIKEAEHKLKRQNLYFKMLTENTDEMFFEYDVHKDVFTLNARRIDNDEKEEHIYNFMGNGKYAGMVHPEDRITFEKAMREASVSACKGIIEIRIRKFADEYHWYGVNYVSSEDEKGVILNIVGIIHNIDHVRSMKSKIASDRKEIERLSNTDPVTGLYNKSAFKLFAEQTLSEVFNDDECFAFVYSDINDFSYVNENFGYDAGDRMLKDFADMTKETSTCVLGCRVYSDYFVSLHRAPDKETLIQAITVRNDSFTENQKKKYPMSNIMISCGIYFVRGAYEQANVAIDNANLARRSVKGSSDMTQGIYTDRMRKKRSHDQRIASEVWSAIRNGDITLFLQPKFDLETREMIGAEALARWRNPDGTYKLPYEFIDILENVGYITQLDFYIYEQTLKCLAKWKKEGKKLVPISVNFSRKHNNTSEFVDKITGLADFYQVDKSLIEIEVTESCFTKEVKRLFTNMRILRERGFKVDIDDFGMGYSSLSVLMEAPADIVKIDKVFIDKIDVSSRSRDYINQICKLITSTKKEIIFEGVETESQASVLMESGHTKAQGWLFDKAIPLDEFEAKYY